jgi:hypothetical protein
MTPADIIIVMLFHAIQQSPEDKQSLVFVLGIMTHVVEELPGDNSALISYIEQIIKRYNIVKNL